MLQEPGKTLFGSYKESKPESAKNTQGPAKNSGAKGSNAKKPPQRGLGVAQLERLRLQDRWKKMTEMPQSQYQHHQTFQYYQNNHHPITLPDPLGSVSVQYLNSPSPYGTGSRHCCDLCCKKKRFNSRNYMGSNGKSDRSAAALPIHGSDFSDREMGGYAARVVGRTSGTGYLGHRNVIDEGVEVRAVHRKGSSAGGAVFMEYEFFPAAGKSTEMRSTYPNKQLDHHQIMWQTAEGSSVVSVGSHEEPSDISATSFGYGIGAASSYHDPVDLSLKLSF